ncbi:unnamed protein product [Effrenium voratum]|uniref:Uncharacterized protein n=1 Tax=Effrenium voratum TaxID=2562239 RepID=A0AA36IJW7_9DINO|nr:unnamed protein product [Effrenium voratum]CAJ1389157.1 unnamed protein product [Effrenium voratum]
MAYPFGKGKGRMGKARLAPDYSFQVMMRDYDSEERKRRIEARYSQQHAAPAAALLSTAAGPLWTRHPKAQDIKNGAAEPATVVDLQLPGESDGEEVDECPGDLQPSDAYDPLQRDYSAAALAAMEKRRQELLANPVQVEAPPAPAAHPAPQQPSQPVQPAQPEQPVQPEPALTRPVEAPFSGQLLRVVHAFDGRQCRRAGCFSSALGTVRSIWSCAKMRRSFGCERRQAGAWGAEWSPTHGTPSAPSLRRAGFLLVSQSHHEKSGEDWRVGAVCLTCGRKQGRFNEVDLTGSWNLLMISLEHRCLGNHWKRLLFSRAPRCVQGWVLKDQHLAGHCFVDSFWLAAR